MPEMVAFAQRYGFRFRCREINHPNRKAGEERSFWTVGTRNSELKGELQRLTRGQGVPGSNRVGIGNERVLRRRSSPSLRPPAEGRLR